MCKPDLQENLFPKWNCKFCFAFGNYESWSKLTKWCDIHGKLKLLQPNIRPAEYSAKHTKRRQILLQAGMLQPKIPNCGHNRK